MRKSFPSWFATLIQGIGCIYMVQHNENEQLVTNLALNILDKNFVEILF